MPATAEPFEAVIITGPRRGEIVRWPVPSTPPLDQGELRALNRALDDFNAAIENVARELRTTLRAIRPAAKEA